MNRGAAFQKTDFSESRCTNYIDQSFILTGRLRCIADLAAKNLNDSSGSDAGWHELILLYRPLCYR